MNEMPKGAVITGDIVNSTLLPPQKARKLTERIKKIIYPHTVEFYRGDSFQAIIREPENALKIVLQIRAAARATDSHCDVKTSTGIGEIKSGSKKPGESTAEAFVLSGRAFDEIEKSGDRLSIISNTGFINSPLELIAVFVDYIFVNLTPKQAEVFLELLGDHSQMDAARKLKKSPSTINKHLQSGGWHELVKIMSLYKKIIHTRI
jgi:hypothetical protein